MTVRSTTECVDALTQRVLQCASAIAQSEHGLAESPGNARKVLARAFGALRRELRSNSEEHSALLSILTPESLQQTYERLLDYRLTRTDSGLRFNKVNGGRKASGSYFTPPQLVQPLLEATVVGSLNNRIAQEVFATESVTDLPPLSHWTAEQRSRAAEVVLSMRVCDPTCGPGVFLVAVAQSLALVLARIRLGDDVLEAPVDCVREVLRCCVYGVDCDPLAVALARFALGLQAGQPQGPLSQVALHLRCRDSLSVAQDRLSAEFAPPMQWQTEFPEVFDNGGFDVVLGNPPFANAIEGGVDALTKEHLSEQYPELVGTSDLAYYFLALGDRLCKPDGAVGFVLPRGVLTSRATEKLRTRLLQERPPVLIYAPQNPYLFPGANVYVVALALRKGGRCLGGRDPDTPNLFPIQVRDINWWAPLVDEAPLQVRSDKTVGDRFEVSASMTTGMAYDVLAAVTDDPKAKGMKLVTTGLIDPGVCYWGERVCRYLKQRFERPVVDSNVTLPAYTAGRLAKVQRPKVLVAGLSTRIEAFVDVKGEYCGAVSTFTIVHAKDDVLELRRLCDYLNSEEPSRLLQVELGAHAIGGGRITVTKAFLQRLPMP